MAMRVVLNPIVTIGEVLVAQSILTKRTASIPIQKLSAPAPWSVAHRPIFSFGERLFFSCFRSVSHRPGGRDCLKHFVESREYSLFPY